MDNQLKFKVKENLPKNWLLLHSEDDDVVPIESTEQLYDGLEQLGISRLVLKSWKGKGGHAKHILDLFVGRGEGLNQLEEFLAQCD